MGEMADWLIDEMVFDEDFMAADISGVICQHCKRGPFYWRQDHLGCWRLYTESGKLHSCRSHKKER